MSGEESNDSKMEVEVLDESDQSPATTSKSTTSKTKSAEEPAEVMIEDDEADSGDDDDDDDENSEEAKKQERKRTVSARDPTTPKVNQLAKMNTSLASMNSAEKLDKNLKLQMKLESARKRQEEKEKKDKEKREREEQRLKREEEARKKKEEEEKAKQKRHEEKLKREEEARKKKEEEEQQRVKKQEELRLKKEEKRLKEEAEKRQRDEEKAEKERVRLEQLKKKEDEKKQRDEEKKQRDEEKKRQEEERLRDEEEKKRKAEKAKSQFVSFFIKKSSPGKTHADEQQQHLVRAGLLRFMPFQPRENMTLAPLCRRADLARMSSEEREAFIKQLDQHILDQSHDQHANYLKELRAKSHTACKQTISCRKLVARADSDVKIVDICPASTSTSTNIEQQQQQPQQQQQTRYKCKYLHFDPKVFKRPPYYGTWRKRSTCVKPRAPFAKDEKLLDYEVNSDDEWEDEPEGESIVDSGEDDDDETVDDEDDDGFFVPHGHLSDDELDEEERQLDPEVKKAREAAKKEQWEAERGKKSSKYIVSKSFMQAKYWLPPSPSTVDDEIKHLLNCPAELRLFERLKMVPLVSTLPVVVQDPPKVLPPDDKANANAGTGTDSFNTPKTKKSSKAGAAAATAANNDSAQPGSASNNNNNKSNKSKKTLQAQFNQPSTSNLAVTDSPSSMTTTSATTTPTVSSKSAHNTPSIISFISKKSNKSVACKLEVVASDDANKPTSSPSTNNTNNNSTKASTNATGEAEKKEPAATGAGNLFRKSSVHLAKCDSAAALKTNTLTSSPSGSNITGEKRVCSGKGENAVKRLRLDPNQMQTTTTTTTNNNSNNNNKSPQILTLNVTSSIKNGSTRKTLKLGDANISTNSMPEASGGVKSNALANVDAKSSSSSLSSSSSPSSTSVDSNSTAATISNNKENSNDVVCLD